MVRPDRRPSWLLPVLVLALCSVVAALAVPTVPTRWSQAMPPAGRWLPVAAPAMADSAKATGSSRSMTRQSMLMPAGKVMMVPAAQPPPLLAPASHTYVRTGGQSVALTFDDGPDPRYTPQVLALLRKHGVKATFCMVGSQVRAHPKLVRQIAAEGHALCNHTSGHDLKLRTRSRAAILADLRETSRAISEASGGVAPRYFRAPGGNWSGPVISAARELGMASLHWAADPRDWTKPSSGTIVARVRSATRPGAIVLLHDGGGDRSRTVVALRTLLPEFTKRYRLVRL